MCGIGGVLHPIGESQNNSSVVTAMMNKIRHRGPDGMGIFSFPIGVFGHVRLAIIDLNERSSQPMHYMGCSITFNGEIYNYLELKAELRAIGHRFVTTSDTEVIIAAFVEWGTASFSRLNGVFSFSLYDGRYNKSYLVRDRYGVKPLYYYTHNKAIWFCSEIKGFFENSQFNPTINRLAASEYFTFGYLTGNQTIYNGVLTVQPGTFLCIDQLGNNAIFPFYDLPNHTDRIIDDEKFAVTETKRLLIEAVKRQTISDVPIALYLSGGIDSSAIAAFATTGYHSTLSSYSVSFDYSSRKGSELPIAAEVARRFGIKHNEVEISVGDFVEHAEALSIIHDQPFADLANLPLYLLSKKTNHKVVLQGDGGDEVFLGYNYHKYIYKLRFYQSVASTAGLFSKMIAPDNSTTKKIDRFVKAICQEEDYKKLAHIGNWNAFHPFPQAVLSEDFFRGHHHQTDPFFNHLKIFKKYGVSSLLGHKQWEDLKILLPNCYLEKVDKPTMSNSVESRVPFLDNDLTDFIFKINPSLLFKNGTQKYLLKKALKGVVPDRVLHGRKRGFGVPVATWMSNKKNKDFLLAVLTDPQIKDSNLFNSKFVFSLISENNTNKEHGLYLWKILNFALWFKHYKPSF